MGLGFHLVKACFLLFLVASIVDADNSTGIFDVKEYGAIADGKTDSAQAFQKAWSEACAMAGNPKILIAEGSYLVGPLTFKGPCKGDVEVQLRGELLAPTDLNAFSMNWIEFQYLDGLTISGSGRLDGQGTTAWPHNECPKKWKCKFLPITLVLSFVNNAKISGISLIDSKIFHMNIFSCNNIHLDSIKISAPGDSPNTDGIHMGVSTNVSITNSVIGTGDDCVSIGPSTNNVTVSGVRCGPGHGISVGSLGKNANEGDVIGLTVTNCTLTGTTNGVRIKTWQSSPAATSAANFVFDDIVMDNVYNPIIIDQKYCPYAACTEQAPSRVRISNVKFQNIRGTSASPVAVNIACSSAIPCKDVELSDIDLEYKGPSAMATTASCVNVNVVSNGNVKPDSCKGSSNPTN